MQEHIDKCKREMIEALSKVVHSKRIATNKSMYAISAECGLSKSTWREAELSSCKNISFSTLWQIAEGLNMKPSELVALVEKELGSSFSFID